MNFRHRCVSSILPSTASPSASPAETVAPTKTLIRLHTDTNMICETSRSIISPAWLHLLPGVHLQAIYQVFFLGSSLVQQVGRVILGAASRLDAFSASPFLT